MYNTYIYIYMYIALGGLRRAEKKNQKKPTKKKALGGLCRAEEEGARVVLEEARLLQRHSF
jgi:hypothetical protein